MTRVNPLHHNNPIVDEKGKPTSFFIQQWQNLLSSITSGAGGGSSSFIGLTDTPAAFTGAALRFLRVNAGETAVQFTPLATIAVSGDGANASYDNSGSGLAATNVQDAIDEVAAVESGLSHAQVMSRLSIGI